MATTTIPWGDGSGDNIYLTYPSASGDQTVAVTSDANTGAARSKVVSFSSNIGSISHTLTVNQAAGEIPGGMLSDYVQNGLYLHLDGKEKGGTSTWVDLINGYAFTNYGSTFASDHVYFDGVDDYLSIRNMGTASDFPTRTSGTIEVVIDNENFGISSGVIFIPKTAARLSASVNGNKGFLYGTDNTSARSYYYPITTMAKASISVNNSNAYENGSTMTLSSDKTYLSGFNSTYYYIGRRDSGLYFKGKIYSIRVYNRKLTQSEVMQNLSVDNKRFNLGLTLE